VKTETAALGFRVKSGWAAAVLLSGPVRSPRLCDNRAIDLSDARFPETRQPYHAAMGKTRNRSGQDYGRACTSCAVWRDNQSRNFSPSIEVS
jgi:hypothetical protein